jgi:putative PIN family toxin of toxin-antitoxin system
VSKPDKIVLDTNVYVSLILYQKVDVLVDLAGKYDLTFFSCPELITELTSTLNKPEIKKSLKLAAEYYVDFVKDLTTNVSIDKRFDRAFDPDDNFLFDLAYTTKCKHIVTRERALLNMKHVGAIQVISLAGLLNLLKQ